MRGLTQIREVPISFIKEQFTGKKIVQGEELSLEHQVIKTQIKFNPCI